ncbi:MAG: glycosyl transferase [Cytophagaceae bacterium SCN 52-12]|nr:MAG: glycosyl transferase [Cytophagaceae bacterium SCN 52-12]
MEPLQTSTEKLSAFVSRLYAGPELPDYTGIDAPRLTIITPSYNQAEFLERTILSVLNQGYPNLEYLIIDGGSTDRSVEVIRKYEKYITYWVSEKDKGQVDALNKGLRRATGEWVAFQNSDDVYFPGTFLHFAKAAGGAEKPADIVYGDLYLIDQHDRATELLKTIPFSLTSQVWEGMQMHNQSLFFRLDLVKRYGLFDESYRFAFDYEFITRYTSAPGVKARRAEGLLGALRVHESAKSSTIADIGRREHEKIRQEYAGKLKQRVPAKIRYLCIRFRKAVYLLTDFAYLGHRLRISRKG